MASSLCTVKIGAGAYAAVAGGINVAPADVITIKLASSAGVDTGSWSITCIYTDETKIPATITALLTVNQSTFEATFTVPAGTGQALIFRSQVNNDTTTRTTFGLYTLVNALRCGAVNETYEGSATYGWVTTMNAAIRALGGGGYTAPTGTGIPHIVGGVQDAASSLIVNADVHASAAIALSKLVNPTGTGLVKAAAGVFDAAAALLVNADVDAAAAIAGSKIAADFSGQTLTLGQILGGTPQVEATTGVVNDLALGAGVALLRVTGTLELTGIAAPSGRRVLLVEVADTGSFVFDHQDARSAATARFEGVGASPLMISARGGAVLLYETGVGFWRCIAKNT